MLNESDYMAQRAALEATVASTRSARQGALNDQDRALYRKDVQSVKTLTAEIADYARTIADTEAALRGLEAEFAEASVQARRDALATKRDAIAELLDAKATAATAADKASNALFRAVRDYYLAGRAARELVMSSAGLTGAGIESLLGLGDQAAGSVASLQAIVFGIANAHPGLAATVHIAGFTNNHPDIDAATAREAEQVLNAISAWHLPEDPAPVVEMVEVVALEDGHDGTRFRAAGDRFTVPADSIVPGAWFVPASKYVSKPKRTAERPLGAGPKPGSNVGLLV